MVSMLAVIQLTIVALCLVLFATSQNVSRTTQEECPDRLLTPNEYESVARYVSTSKTTDSSCVIITQCSVDRLATLENQARLWGGEVSSAVYVPTTSTAAKVKAMKLIHDLIVRLDADASYTGRLTLSVLFGHEDASWRWSCKHEAAVGFPLYPINALRNLALAAAGTRNRLGAAPIPLYFLLDVDFMPSPGLHQWVEQNAQNKTFMGLIKSGSMIVVPAFETHLPVRKPTLPAVLVGLRKNTVQVFHSKRFPPGHLPTNTPKWRELSSQAQEQRNLSDVFHNTYPITYDRGYEPYIILGRDHIVAYDERFRGYGQNKHVQLKWLLRRNPSFHVLLDHFVVAEEHAKSHTAKTLMGSATVFARDMMGAFHTAMNDLDAGKMPLVSDGTGRLFAAHGWGKIYDLMPWQLLVSDVDKRSA